jgi:hypothetical protein
MFNAYIILQLNKNNEGRELKIESSRHDESQSVFVPRVSAIPLKQKTNKPNQYI